MPNLLSANLIVCDMALIEKETTSAIRIIDTLTIPAAASTARFFTVVSLFSSPGDFIQHSVVIQMVDPDRAFSIVAAANPHNFAYGHRINFNGPGGLVLTTEFNLDLSKLAGFGLFYIQAVLDGEIVATVPLTLRRAR